MSANASIRSFWQSFPQLPFLIVGGASAILYLSGFGSLFFLVPYAWLLTVYPVRNVSLAVAVSGTAIGVTRLIQSAAFSVLVTELLIFGSFLLVLCALFIPFRGRLRQLRGLYRMLIPVSLFMVVTLPFVYSRIQDPELLVMLTNIFGELLEGQNGGVGTLPTVGEEGLYQLITNVLRVICGIYVALYMMLPLISWWIVQVMRLLSPRLFQRVPADHKSYALEQFRLPHDSIWVFIALVAILLLFFVFGIQSVVFYACTNAVVILALLYTMQGLALIMRISMRRYSRVQVVRGLLFIGLIILLIPVVNSILLIGVCVLGVSQTWVNYDLALARKNDGE